ncbi:uncharacterized protein [Physcomitrium patens]|uniref:uncharacterized protein n=1 Tax=Physcomitrium patens TaxID=3218 RepID=UPI003CCDAE06
MVHLNYPCGQPSTIAVDPRKIKSGATATITVSGFEKKGVNCIERQKEESVYSQAVKTGSLCCVAARPHGSSDNGHNWSSLGDKPRWHTNEGYVPPLSSSHLDQLHGEDYVGTSSRTFSVHRRSLSLSGRGSRSWRRVDGSRLYNHYRTPSGSLYGGSPNNFIWNPLASSSHRIADSTTAESEIVASPLTSAHSSKAEHILTRPPAISIKSESTSSSFLNVTKAPPAPHLESGLPSSSHGNDSALSKPSFLVPGNPSRREHYEGRFPPTGPGQVPSLDGRFSFHRSNSSRSSSAGGSSDWSSFNGFMEAGSDARQEWLRVSNATSPSDYHWGTNRSEEYDRGSGQMCMEKITARSSQSTPSSPCPENCGVCSRGLTQRSPWASSRFMGFHECNVVGVLVCGHTYHTECLEQITPDSSRQDPACPRCSSGKVASKQPIVSMPTLKSGTVRGSSFMSRPSPRNKLSRIGVLDDTVSFGKPRFSISSPGEPSS